MDICLTGASRGLGAALSRELVARGHRVWGVSRDTGSLNFLRAQLGPKFRMSAVDIRSTEAVKAWVAAVAESDFTPDAVIVNASILTEDLGDGDYDLAAAQNVIDTNLIGALRCVHAFLPQFLAKKSGRFTLIASTTALRPSDRSASYAASKAGAAMAFRSLSMRYAPQGVRFQTLYLGPVSTDMWEGKKSSLVPEPEVVARRIAGFVREPRDTLFYPWVTTWLLRMSLWLPDGVFAWATRKALKSD